MGKFISSPLPRMVLSTGHFHFVSDPPAINQLIVASNGQLILIVLLPTVSFMTKNIHKTSTLHFKVNSTIATLAFFHPFHNSPVLSVNEKLSFIGQCLHVHKFIFNYCIRPLVEHPLLRSLRHYDLFKC